VAIRGREGYWDEVVRKEIEASLISNGHPSRLDSKMVSTATVDILSGLSFTAPQNQLPPFTTTIN